MLSTVDDLSLAALAGPKDAHGPFWAKLAKMIRVEPPEPISRVRARHVFINPPHRMNLI